MYNIGDNVVYGANGVMTVIDICEQSIADTKRSYYVLKSPVGHKDSLTFVPVDNEKLTSIMRPLLSKDEVLKIIDDIPSIDEVEWIPDNRTRADRFKVIVEKADPRELVGMIKAIWSVGVRRGEEGKKNYLADENAMKKAEHVLYSELSSVLGIKEEDVPAHIAAVAPWISFKSEAPV